MLDLNQWYQTLHKIEIISYSAAAVGTSQVGYGIVAKDFQSVMDGLELLIVGSSSGRMSTFGRKAAKEQQEYLKSCPELNNILNSY